ncbi:MAG: hypothetical protein RIB32_03455 [Phycisphaerales bacterium]
MTTTTAKDDSSEAKELTEDSINDPELIVPSGTPVAPPKKSLGERFTAFCSRLSTRNNFWHRFFSCLYLPIAFKSGIKMKRLDTNTFAAVLPFRRFNKNFYNAMAGAALLANAEIAGGLYIFALIGDGYTVVCKELNYRFLRPCFGPAIYKVVPKDDMAELLAGGGEFNYEMVLNVFQQIKTPGNKEPRVGRVHVTFHLTPIQHVKERSRRRRHANARRKSRQSADD